MNVFLVELNRDISSIKSACFLAWHSGEEVRITKYPWLIESVGYCSIVNKEKCGDNLWTQDPRYACIDFNLVYYCFLVFSHLIVFSIFTFILTLAF